MTTHSSILVVYLDPAASQGQRCLMGFSSYGHKELGTAEQ